MVLRFLPVLSVFVVVFLTFLAAALLFASVVSLLTWDSGWFRLMAEYGFLYRVALAVALFCAIREALQGKSTEPSQPRRAAPRRDALPANACCAKPARDIAD